MSFYLVIGAYCAFPVLILLIINLLYQLYYLSKQFVIDNKWGEKNGLLALCKVFFPKCWFKGITTHMEDKLDSEDSSCIVLFSNGIIIIIGVAFFLGWIVSIPFIGYIYLLHGIRFCFRTKKKLDKHIHDKDSGKVTY